jgi:hypothetical protein
MGRQLAAIQNRLWAWQSIQLSRQLDRRFEQIGAAVEVGSGGADAAVSGQRLEQVNGNALVG